MFPSSIDQLVKDLECKLITEAHCSGDTVYQFEDHYILKVSDNLERLRRERKANDFLKGKLPERSCETCAASGRWVTQGSCS